MGVIVKPKNLNDRQMKRVDKIESSNPLRARTVASRISERRDARGAENPQIAKAIAARRTMTQPMKRGGKIIKKAQFGYNLGKAAGAVAGKVSRVKASLKKVRGDVEQAERNYKTADSLSNANPKIGPGPKGLKKMVDERTSNREKADSLRKAGRKLEGLDYKKGGKMIKKAKNGTSFGMLSVKAGIDKNPKPTAADRIAGAKKQAKSGTKMMKKGGKCKNGC